MQGLQVRECPENPDLADCDTGDAIPCLEDEGMLSAEESRVLLDTWRLGVKSGLCAAW